MGPSRNDQAGLPLFWARSFSNAPVRSQNSRIARSWAGKSICVSTLSKDMCHSLFTCIVSRPQHEVNGFTFILRARNASVLLLVQPMLDDRREVGGADAGGFARRDAIAA